MGWNKHRSVLVGKYNIAWEYCHFAYPYGCIDGGRCHILDIGRIMTLHPSIKTIGSLQLLHVSNRTIEHHPFSGLPINGIPQAGSYEGAVFYLAVAFCHINITFS